MSDEPIGWAGRTWLVLLNYSQRRLGLKSGLQGGHLESFQMDSGRGNLGQEW